MEIAPVVASCSKSLTAPHIDFEKLPLDYVNHLQLLTLSKHTKAQGSRLAMATKVVFLKSQFRLQPGTMKPVHFIPELNVNDCN